MAMDCSNVCVKKKLSDSAKLMGVAGRWSLVSGRGTFASRCILYLVTLALSPAARAHLN